MVKFRDKKNNIVEARVEAGNWEIISREKKQVRVHRTNRTLKKEDAENRGKVIKEVIVVLDTLSNDDFKNQYAPANHAAVDLFESMPEAQPIEEDKPKTIKTSKTLS